ncbi:DNA gyrase C-terminal beta-propeller domain-containing protein, partial [uncultured Selenomonas sp.]
SLRQNSEVLTVTAEGYGKRTEAGEYRIQTRGGKGLINLKVTDKTGDVIGLRVVHPDQELMLITEDGIVIRTTISDIRNTGRNASGVKLITTNEGDKVASMAVLDQKD